MEKSLEEYCWSINLDREFTEKLKPFKLPRLKQALSFLGLSIR